MNRTHLLPIGGATALAALTLAPLGPAEAAQQPAKGFVLSCDQLGKLTGATGHLAVAEPVVDDHGHGHVYFTVATVNVTLKDTDGTSYRFYGSGYDDVLRSTMDAHSPVLRESERFRFDVVGPSGVVGRVRFSLHDSGHGRPKVKDAGDCHLPQGDQ